MRGKGIGVNLVSVNLSEIKFSNRDSDVLVAYSLGSCVGVALWDLQYRFGAMAHVMLPNRLGNGEEPPGKYAETAIPYLVSKFRRMGSKISNLEAKIAGGANINTNLSLVFGRIGDMNIKAVCNALSKEGISVLGKHVGGNDGRTMRLYIGSGRVTIYSAQDGETEI